MMFDPHILSKIFQVHKKTFYKMRIIAERLSDRFYDMDRAITALLLSAAADEPLLLIGPPGCGKSRLIRAFCGEMGFVNENDLSEPHPDYFEYILTRFTEPGELFGFYDLKKLEVDKKLEREEGEKLQDAQVVFLDEIFNASSAILNTLLAVMNERIFHDRGKRCNVKMECLFAATNYPPQTEELQAFYDRFILRSWVDNVSTPSPQDLSGELEKLLAAGWQETYSDRGREPVMETLLAEMKSFRADLKRMTSAGHLGLKNTTKMVDNMAQIVHHIRDYELSEMSNRRLVKFLYIMLIHRLLRAVDEEEPSFQLGEPELELMPDYLLDRREPEVVEKLVRRIHDLWGTP